MQEFVTKTYFTVTQKNGSKKQYECRGFEETAETYELLLTSGEWTSFKKAAIKSFVCTSFEPYWKPLNH